MSETVRVIALAAKLSDFDASGRRLEELSRCARPEQIEFDRNRTPLPLTRART